MKALEISPKIDKGIKTISEVVNEIQVIDEKSATKAGEVVKEIADLTNKVEAQRLEFTKPLNESLKSINSFFKKFSAPLAELDDVIRGKLVEFKKSGVSEENKFGEVHFTTRQVVEIEDETKIPREYLMPDMAKIKKSALAGIQIPGIKVSEEKGVSL